jgi:hypothetical protein
VRLGGLDIATTTGLALALDETITTSSFRPSVKRPFDLDRNEVDFGFEGEVCREFRDHLRPWLVDNGIEAVGIEKPLPPNITITKTTVDTQAQFYGEALRKEIKGGTTFATIFRIYALVGQACELCARLNIPVYLIEQGIWRQSFIGTKRAPDGTSDASKWLKERSKRQCELLRIHVPNLDAAEAVGVVWHLRGMLNPRLAGRAEDLFRERT